MAIRFFDMFSGIGGFRSGLEAIGGSSVGFSQKQEVHNTSPCVNIVG